MSRKRISALSEEAQNHARAMQQPLFASTTSRLGLLTKSRMLSA